VEPEPVRRHETYSKLLEPRPATDKAGLCWPGGHAATGFCLFALFFVLRDRRPRLAKAALGWPCGRVGAVGGQDDAGCALLSHNIWTAVFCWLIGLGSITWCCIAGDGEDRWSTQRR
jgi:membrane-associated PAP2 superfamily phosphatase